MPILSNTPGVEFHMSYSYWRPRVGVKLGSNPPNPDNAHSLNAEVRSIPATVILYKIRQSPTPAKHMSIKYIQRMEAQSRNTEAYVTPGALRVFIKWVIKIYFATKIYLTLLL